MVLSVRSQIRQITERFIHKPGPFKKKQITTSGILNFIAHQS